MRRFWSNAAKIDAQSDSHVNFTFKTFMNVDHGLGTDAGVREIRVPSSQQPNAINQGAIQRRYCCPNNDHETSDSKHAMSSIVTAPYSSVVGIDSRAMAGRRRR